ncbi:hypothetical protein ACIBXA_31745 [Micromonospora echinaurantiaca]|uniref:hypothetical protein n=1 Tax=Micromonospora echinaurantiaca TaxID=47857 RepID=UPI00379777CB
MAAQFGYDLDEIQVLAGRPAAAVDCQVAQLCAVLIEHVTGVADATLRYTISQDPDQVHGVVADTVAAIALAWRAIAVVLAAAVTTGAARQSATSGTHATDSGLWRPAVVRIAGTHGGPYPCQIGPQDWNGWARPRFTRDVVARLVADIGEQWRRAGEHPDSVPARLLAGGEVLLRHDEDVQEVIGPDDDDMFAVGAGTWVWEEWPD